MTRRKHDFYPTPEWATEELLKHVKIDGRVFECCVGDGAISRVFEGLNYPVLTNDIDGSREAHLHGDAASTDFWTGIKKSYGKPDWIVTNPPFNQAIDIVVNAHVFAKKGLAMLLRLSFLEPTEDRGAFLNMYPPDKVVVLPRISFTGDGKTDSVTCAWMNWSLDKVYPDKGIIVAENPKFRPTPLPA